MSWLRAIPFLFTLLAFVLQSPSASAFGNAHPEARVSAVELVALASLGTSAETSPGLHEGIGEAYDENASGYRFAARDGVDRALHGLLAYPIHATANSPATYSRREQLPPPAAKGEPRNGRHVHRRYSCDATSSSSMSPCSSGQSRINRP
jgi:hypothetical protein